MLQENGSVSHEGALAGHNGYAGKVLIPGFLDACLQQQGGIPPTLVFLLKSHKQAMNKQVGLGKHWSMGIAPGDILYHALITP